MTDKNTIGLLLYKHLQGTLTDEEAQLLEEWRRASEDNALLMEEIDNEEMLTKRLEQFHPDNKKAVRDKILQRILAARHEHPAVRRLPSLRWVAAASIVLALVAGTYFWWQPDGKARQAETVSTLEDVEAPQFVRAVITLADGSTVSLDSVANGSVAVQGNINIVKDADGKLSYQPSASAKGKEQEEIYNTLHNPRGSKVIDIALADGSRVWLNVGSSLTYPVAFVGKERKVSITGEAYFEVARNATKPFIVDRGEMSVQVLGTHFNVNAYEDEADIRVTLLEGSVKISDTRNAASGIIKPGEQAVFSQAKDGEQIRVTDDVNVEEVIAWTNGMFHFAGASVAYIMRQIQRWYDVEVEYMGDVSSVNLSGIVSRKKNITNLLGALEATGKIVFKLEGRKVIVLPGKY
ncbi:MAG: FecR domain-containing protein [Chitinophagaceae bacterium]|nr:FecR domain-containing protein [Chitinophagaceae bacterium]